MLHKDTVTLGIDLALINSSLDSTLKLAYYLCQIHQVLVISCTIHWTWPMLSSHSFLWKVKCFVLSTNVGKIVSEPSTSQAVQVLSFRNIRVKENSILKLARACSFITLTTSYIDIWVLLKGCLLFLPSVFKLGKTLTRQTFSGKEHLIPRRIIWVYTSILSCVTTSQTGKQEIGIKRCCEYFTNLRQYTQEKERFL